MPHPYLNQHFIRLGIYIIHICGTLVPVTIFSSNEVQHVNDQHTTPKCYLKNFSEDGSHIFRKHKKANKFDRLNPELDKPTSLKSATVRDNFYTLKSGNEPMGVETLIYDREIENHYGNYYELLVNPQIDILPSMEARSRLLMCLLTLHCRTPKQFRLFFEMFPDKSNIEMEQINEDYKGVHLSHTLTNFIEAHQFKVIRMAKITDTSEFLSSDNPVLIINSNGELVNNNFQEQFNKDNRIVIPLDPKHCFILTNATDKNGISIEGKVFHNVIERVEVDCSFTQNINYKMLESAELYYCGREKYIKAFFNYIRLVDE